MFLPVPQCECQLVRPKMLYTIYKGKENDSIQEFHNPHIPR